jgi:phage terminase small subunit
MTPKEWLFCNEYLVDLNATRAAARAGYSPHSARQIGSENLSKPYIAEAVGRLIAVRTGVTRTGIVNELARIGFSDIRKVVEWRPEVTERIEEDATGEEQVTRTLVSKVLVKDSATLDDDTAAAVASISRGANGILSVKMHDKVAALEKLARVFNMFKEQAAVNANLTPTIILTGRPDTPSAS